MFSIGTKILMFNGNVKTVEKLKIGDLLMGANSDPVIVSYC
jgi:hypothetical protein